MTPAEAVAHLRARLDAKRDELLKALNAMSAAGVIDTADSVSDCLFRLLGIVTFWQTLPDPSEKMIADVNRALDMVSIKVVAAARGQS